jgi:hypothetical protein
VAQTSLQDKEGWIWWGKRVRKVRQVVSRKSILTQGFEKCPWRKVHKGSNGINIHVKFCLNYGPQKPEIYIANIPGVSNIIRQRLMKINYSADPRLVNTGLDNVGFLTSHNPIGLHGLLQE